MQTVIDSILINYEILGAKNKNVILILHGWQNSLKNWENVAKNLSKNHLVILMDMPGFGNSSMPKNRVFDTYDYAEIVNKFIDKFELEKLTLIGHSFGGKTSVIAASNNPKIKKLILVDSSGIKEYSFMVSSKIFLSKLFKNILPQTVLKYLSSDDYKNAGNLLDTFKKIVGQDISEDAKKIKMPALIIWGENDKDVPISSAKKFKNLIQNSSLRIVWKAGHHPHLDRPEKFLEIVEEFLI
jgi:pimeloyl-ACP methyl ester carboxylesterase